MVAQVPIDSPYETFSDVAKELFCDGIYNWGRIVTLFYFTYKLIMKVSSRRENCFLYMTFEFQSLKDQTSSIWNVLVEWTVRFVKEIVAPWIVRKGGWVNFSILLSQFYSRFFLLIIQLVILRDAVPQSRLGTIGAFLSGVAATFMVFYYFRRV